jgi:hypothetical protein
MDNDLNRYFVTFEIYQDGIKVNSLVVPISLIHDEFQNWKFPGSTVEVRVIDHTSNFRISSKILDPR